MTDPAAAAEPFLFDILLGPLPPLLDSILCCSPCLVRKVIASHPHYEITKAFIAVLGHTFKMGTASTSALAVLTTNLPHSEVRVLTNNQEVVGYWTPYHI